MSSHGDVSLPLFKSGAFSVLTEILDLNYKASFVKSGRGRPSELQATGTRRWY